MADVTPIRRGTAAGADGYGPRDVVVDADGEWWQHSERDGWWHGFGGGAYAHGDMIPRPWTLIARAGETTDLVRARQVAMALEVENAELRRGCGLLADLHRPTPTDPGVCQACAGEVACESRRTVAATLARADRARGTE